MLMGGKQVHRHLRVTGDAEHRQRQTADNDEVWGLRIENRGMKNLTAA
jgi:hypothetical protein